MCTQNELAFREFQRLVPSLIDEAQYSEIYGFDFSKNIQTVAHERIIRNYLVDCYYNVKIASSRFVETLKWRKEFQPLRAASTEVHTTRYEGFSSTKKIDNLVYTWHRFSHFEDSRNPNRRMEMFSGARREEFLRWQVGQLERDIAMMNLEGENEVLPHIDVLDFSDVPGYGVLSFGMDHRISSKTYLTIQARHYPGLIGARYFINLPVLMSWVLMFFQLRLGKRAGRLFIECKREKLAKHFGNWVPEAYGGTGDFPSLLGNQRGHELCLSRYNSYNGYRIAGKIPAKPGKYLGPVTLATPPANASASETISFFEWKQSLSHQSRQLETPSVSSASSSVVSSPNSSGFNDPSPNLFDFPRKRRLSEESLCSYYSTRSHYTNYITPP